MYKYDKQTFIISYFEPKFKSMNNNKKINIDSVNLNFPFNIGIIASILKNEKDISKKVVISLGNRRILNSSECCANCIKQSIESLKEIKSDLIDYEKELSNNINSPTFYFIDFIISSINQFLNYIEKNNINNKFDEYRNLYFDALAKIRNHITQCLYQISKIANIKINSNIYAIRENVEEWKKEYYIKEKTIDILL